MLEKIVIHNYRVFRDFMLEFTPGMNILVGDNDAGKSTLLEAINLVLTGHLHGFLAVVELSPYLCHRGVRARTADLHGQLESVSFSPSAQE